VAGQFIPWVYIACSYIMWQAFRTPERAAKAVRRVQSDAESPPLNQPAKMKDGGPAL